MDKTVKNILFIIPAQYGYHTDSYKYCEILSEYYSRHYNVTYLGLALGKKECLSQKVKIYSVDKGNSLSWRYNLYRAAKKLKKQIHFDTVFIYSFPLCSLFLFLFSRKSLIMDIRTSVIEGKYKSIILNHLLKIESTFFKRISVISIGVATFLRLNKTKCRILPLGGDEQQLVEKNKEQISLLYVGTFYDRHIEKTIDGFAMFVQKHPNRKISYTIVGIGSDLEKREIIDRIVQYKLNNVHFVGEKRHEELVPYLKSHNVGISYIPLTNYYDCQPPTKTYEYLLSSMIVIATPTTENKKIINSKNGILLQSDSPIDFAKGLEQLWLLKNSFDFKEIFRGAQKYSWNNIVSNYLIPIVED